MNIGIDIWALFHERRWCVRLRIMEICDGKDMFVFFWGGMGMMGLMGMMMADCCYHLPGWRDDYEVIFVVIFVGRCKDSSQNVFSIGKNFVTLHLWHHIGPIRPIGPIGILFFTQTIHTNGKNILTAKR